MAGMEDGIDNQLFREKFNKWLYDTSCERDQKRESRGRSKHENSKLHDAQYLKTVLEKVTLWDEYNALPSREKKTEFLQTHDLRQTQFLTWGQKYNIQQEESSNELRLYKRGKYKNSNSETVEANRRVCAREEVFDIIQAIHTSYGHKRTPTMERVVQEYDSIGHSIVKKFHDMCPHCNKPSSDTPPSNDKSVTTHPGFRHRYSIAAIDFSEAPSKNGMGRAITHLLYLHDMETNYILLAALENVDESTVAEQVCLWCSQIGLPLGYETQMGRDAERFSDPRGLLMFILRTMDSHPRSRHICNMLSTQISKHLQDHCLVDRYRWAQTIPAVTSTLNSGALDRFRRTNRAVIPELKTKQLSAQRRVFGPTYPLPEEWEKVESEIKTAPGMENSLSQSTLPTTLPLDSTATSRRKVSVTRELALEVCREQIIEGGITYARAVPKLKCTKCEVLRGLAPGGSGICVSVMDEAYYDTMSRGTAWWHYSLVSTMATLLCHKQHHKEIPMLTTYVQHVNPDALSSSQANKYIPTGKVACLGKTIHHFGLLVADSSKREVTIYDDYCYDKTDPSSRLQTWDVHVQQLLCKLGYPSEDHRLWKTSVANSHTIQADSHSCGPRVCLRLCEIYGYPSSEEIDAMWSLDHEDLRGKIISIFRKLLLEVETAEELIYTVKSSLLGTNPERKQLGNDDLCCFDLDAEVQPLQTGSKRKDAPNVTDKGQETANVGGREETTPPEKKSTEPMEAIRFRKLRLRRKKQAF